MPRLVQNMNIFKERPIAPLIIFRIIWGFLMFFGVVRFLLNGWVNDLYIAPKYHFGYLGFEWVQPLPDNWMYLPFILMVLASVGILFGYLYKWSATLFFLCFTYVELLDKTNYLNHYYFVSLLSFILIFLPANRDFSLDVRWGRVAPRSHVSNWHIWLVQFQLGVVYFFAGVAKLNVDWLMNAQPLKIWLQAHHDLPIVGGWMQQDWLAYGFSWMGCIYDLLIVFVLLSSWRRIGYAAVVFFHLVTWYLFPIGVFPWVMIFATWIFFSNEFHANLLNRLKRSLKFISKQTLETPRVIAKKWIVASLALFVSVQLLLPFRHYLYPGELFWNEEGFRFSWRVMLMHKEGHAFFYVVDQKTRREIEINLADYLTANQIDQMVTQPDMILQFSKILHDEYNGKTLHFGEQSFQLNDPKIEAEIYVSLNGRPSQLFVDRRNDLSKLNYNLSHRNWLEPFDETIN